METSNKQVIQAAFDAWRGGTGGVFDLLAAEAVWTIVGNSPVSRTFNSKQEFFEVFYFFSMITKLFCQQADQSGFREGENVFAFECGKKKGDHPLCVAHANDLYGRGGFE